MKISLVTIILFFLAQNAMAESWTCSTPSPYTCDGISIKIIYLNLDKNRIYFGEKTATHYFSTGDGTSWTDSAKTVYSLLLTAKSTQNKVNTYAATDGKFKNVKQIILTEN